MEPATSLQPIRLPKAKQMEERNEESIGEGKATTGFLLENAELVQVGKQ